MSDMIDRDAAIALADAKATEWARAAYTTDDGRLQNAARVYAAHEIIAAIRALPAVEVGVKPGEIERAVWSAMMWAADNNPGFNGVPEYTDRGNSFAEDEARRAAARIRSALTIAPAPDAGKVQALVDAVQSLLQSVCGPTGFAEAVRHNSGKAYPWHSLDAAEAKARAALAAMKEG